MKRLEEYARDAGLSKAQAFRALKAEVDRRTRAGLVGVVVERATCDASTIAEEIRVFVDVRGRLPRAKDCDPAGTPPMRSRKSIVRYYGPRGLEAAIEAANVRAPEQVSLFDEFESGILDTATMVV